MGINGLTHNLLTRYLPVPRAQARLVLLGQLFMRGEVTARYKRASKYYRAQGYGQVVDIDINGKADVRLDLGQPVPAAWHSSCHALVNGGTGEHVGDLATFWQNCHDMVKPGGLMVHVGPQRGSFKGHSPHHYSVAGLKAVARAYGYEILFINRQQHIRGWAIYTAWVKGG